MMGSVQTIYPAVNTEEVQQYTMKTTLLYNMPEKMMNVKGTAQKNCSGVDRPRNYHMSNPRECMGVNGEALKLHAVYKSCNFY